MSWPVATSRAGTSTTWRTQREQRERASGLAVLLGSMTVFGLAVTLVSTGWGQRLDRHAMGAVAVDWRTRAHLVEGLDLLTPTNPAEMTIAMVALLAVSLARRRFGDAVAVVAILVSANVAAQLVKHVLGRPDHGLGTLNSFPSGHVTAVTSLSLALVLVVPRAWRSAAVFAGGVASTLVAVATVSARWHRPSDVIGAVAIALGSGAAVVLALAAIRYRRPAQISAPAPAVVASVPGAALGSWLVQLSAAPVAAAALLLLGVRPRAGHSLPVAELLVLAIGLVSVAAIGVFSSFVGADPDAVPFRRSQAPGPPLTARGDTV